MLGYIISDKEEINVIEHEIQSFDILRKTDLNIFVVENGKVLYKYDIINNASENGHVQVLEWFKRSGYKFKYDNWAIIRASRYGHVQVLEWFKHSGYKFKYDNYAITWASRYGHVQVLEWFKHSGHEFKYNKSAIINAKNIIILKFFIENITLKKVIKWSEHAIVKTIKFKAKKRYLKGYRKN